MKSSKFQVEITHNMLDEDLLIYGFAFLYKPKQVKAIRYRGVAKKYFAVPSLPVFTRATIAYKQDGSAVLSGAPRYESSKFLQGLMIEAGATNLVKNAGFETGSLTPWISMMTPGTGESVAVTASVGYGGGYALKVIALGLKSYLGASQTLTGWTAGGTYTVSLRVKVESRVAGTIRADITGTVTTSYGGIFTLTAVTSGYVTYSKTITLNAGETGLAVRLYANNTPNAVFYYDNIQIEAKSYATSPIIASDATTQAVRNAEVLTIPTAGIFAKNDWAVEFNFNMRSTLGGSDNRHLFDIGISATNQYTLLVTPAGVLQAQVRCNSANATIASAAGTIVLNTDYSVMLSGNGTHIRLCVNGVQIGTDTAYAEPVGDLPVNMHVGCYWNGATQQANSIIGDLRFSSSARTLAEHQAYYNSNLPHVSDAHTTALIDFNESINGNLFIR